MDNQEYIFSNMITDDYSMMSPDTTLAYYYYYFFGCQHCNTVLQIYQEFLILIIFSDKT